MHEILVTKLKLIPGPQQHNNCDRDKIILGYCVKIQTIEYKLTSLPPIHMRSGNLSTDPDLCRMY